MPSTDHIFRMYAEHYRALRVRFPSNTSRPEVLRRAVQYVSLLRVAEHYHDFEPESQAIIIQLKKL